MFFMPRSAEAAREAYGVVLVPVPGAGPNVGRDGAPTALRVDVEATAALRAARRA